MKLFKKTYPLIGIMLLGGGTLLAKKVDELEEALQSIGSKHTKIFSKNNLFDKRNEETDDWYKLLGNVRSYVTKNAGGNVKLLEA